MPSSTVAAPKPQTLAELLSPADRLRAEPQETNGLTSRLMLAYAEREGGRDAVDALLERSGCSGLEEALLDENTWFSFDRKIALFEALADVLGDEEATRRAGAAALDFNVGNGLKIALRALGSPRLVYQHIVRANAKFSVRHEMQLVELGRDWARIRFRDVTGGDVHPLDCGYNIGLLSCVPALFGLPAASVSHGACGTDTCTYDVKWERGALSLRSVVAGFALTGATAAGGALAAPVLLPAAGAVGAGLAALGAVRVARAHAARLKRLESEVYDQAVAAERLAASLHDVVSELHLEEVLDKIVANARAAVAGKEFLLLVDEEGVRACRSSGGLPESVIRTVEAWGAQAGALTEPLLVEDVAVVPALAALTEDLDRPMGTLCAAPLMFRGEEVGVLVALSAQARTFLPRDVDVVRIYAAQAAVALANARTFEAQKALATRDPLTGLLNHREFHEAVEREIARCRRHGSVMSVALFDLDGFKLVNDGAGHAEGDRVLREAAAALAGACRDSDLAFRIGGDEFALLLCETDGPDADTAADRARRAIAGVDPRTSASFGVASWPADGGSKDVVLAQADANLYLMKRGAHPRARSRGEDSASLQRERLALASRLSAKLAPILDPEAIGACVVRELHETFDYSLAYVLRREGDLLRAVKVGGTVATAVEAHGWTQGVEEGVCGRVVRSRQTALVHDTALDGDHLGVDPGRTGWAARSELIVPLVVGGEIWGVLGLEDEHVSAFSSDDVLLVEMVAAQVGAAVHRSELLTELDGAFTTTLSVLCDALETKDDYTASHADGVAELCVRVAERLGLTGQDLRDVQYGGLLHDIGKIAVPTEILTKPGPLTEDERAVMERHTAVGGAMLARIPFFASVHQLVRSSHERWDGRGYPDRLAGEGIPLGARIICACDAFHAMTSDRPYRAALPREVAAEELERCAGTQFDPTVVRALLAVLTD